MAVATRVNSKEVLGSASLRSGTVNSPALAASAVSHTHLDDELIRSAVFMYDFAVSGGAISAIALTDSAGAASTLPAGASILNAWIRSITLPVGASATIKLGITGNDDLFVAATAITDAMFVASTKTVTVLNKETPVVVGASAVSVLATIATTPLTAGKFAVIVQWLPSIS